jgi:hypothetical protein
MVIRLLQKNDFTSWLHMRINMWPNKSPIELLYEMMCIYRSAISHDSGESIVYVCERTDGSLSGFIEASVKPVGFHDKSNPVGYIKALYIDPEGGKEEYHLLCDQLMRKAKEWLALCG